MPANANPAAIGPISRSTLGGHFEQIVTVADIAVAHWPWASPVPPDVPIDQHPYDQAMHLISGSTEVVPTTSTSTCVSRATCST